MNKSKSYIPWIEKYRPNNFSNIVLDPLNRQLMYNIIDKEYFQNLLFYGQPGTGKTTVIINLISKYQEKMNQQHKGLMIHLNASDERGIDIIRNQIQQFVNSKNLFHKGLKFVILDEVDYMTKNAQQALRYLIMSYSNTVRFCLICNYISKIDENLQNEFVHIRFNKLPENEITNYLKNITANENITINEDGLASIQKYYKSDLRSMINYIQSQYTQQCFQIINDNLWDNLYTELQTKTLAKCITTINLISNDYNIGKKNIIKDFLNYIIHHKKTILTSELIMVIENIIHFPECDIATYLNYSLSQLMLFFPKL